MKTIFITGATAGIGKAAAEKFAAAGNNLIITGRRKDRLENHATELKNKFQVQVLSLNFDVRNFEEVKNAVDSIPENFKNIDVLINNAGLAAGLGTIQEGSLDDWDTMIDTNIKGLLYVSKMIIPLMIQRSKGHIVNIGSIAGKEVYAKGNVYCATKHAVDALSKAMRIDLLPHGIKVTNIAPGAVETEFSLVRMKGDEEKAKNVYKGYKPLSAIDIAESIFYVISLPDHVVINDLLITPFAQANTANLLRTE
jgi:3-hydroxy acid dehydrogenase / malonic semialdehyde reductase